MTSRYLVTGLYLGSVALDLVGIVILGVLAKRHRSQLFIKYHKYLKFRRFDTEINFYLYPILSLSILFGLCFYLECFLFNFLMSDSYYDWLSKSFIPKLFVTGYTDVLRILLEAGFYIDRKDADGWTPLHAAAHWEQFECCKILGKFFNSGKKRFFEDISFSRPISNGTYRVGL